MIDFARFWMNEKRGLLHLELGNSSSVLITPDLEVKWDSSASLSSAPPNHVGLIPLQKVMFWKSNIASFK